MMNDEREEDKKEINKYWHNEKYNIKGVLKYRKISNKPLGCNTPLIVIYSGHLRSFRETYKTHPQEICTDYKSFATIMHTWDTVYPETLSWHEQNINKDAADSRNISQIINSVTSPEYLKIDSQDLDPRHRIDKNKIDEKSIDGMNYGLLFFKHSRQVALEMAIDFAEKNSLSQECLCVIMRPDIAFRKTIDFKILFEETESSPVYFYKSVKSDRGTEYKAVDAVISARLNDLMMVAKLQNNQHIIDKLKPSTQGEFGKYWTINRN